jgi:hypothetical protein
VGSTLKSVLMVAAVGVQAWHRRGPLHDPMALEVRVFRVPERSMPKVPHHPLVEPRYSPRTTSPVPYRVTLRALRGCRFLPVREGDRQPLAGGPSTEVRGSVPEAPACPGSARVTVVPRVVGGFPPQ